MNLKSLTRADIRQLVDSSEIFHRGEEYFESGAINRFSLSSNEITAKVLGNYGNYTVNISEADDDLELECDCPYEGEVCKHIIAVLLYYLEGKHKNEIVSEANVPKALELTLEAMSQSELLQLVLKLAAENTSFRQLLLDKVIISPAVINQQARNSPQVKKLKKQIAAVFKELQYQYHDDYYDDSEAEYPELDPLFTIAKTLNPADQVEVFWHVIECGEESFQEYPGSTVQIEEAIRLFAEAVKTLNLPHKEKQIYFKNLINALEWEICGYGDTTKAIGQALDTIATERDDYLFLINKLKKTDDSDIEDWVIGYYLKLGDEKKYLQLRQENLRTEQHYLELAGYWKQKGDSVKYLSTLEAWVTKLYQDKKAGHTSYFFPYRETEGILKTLARHYEDQQDTQNLCRILMAMAEFEHFSIDLYKRIETVAGKLGTWSELKPQLIHLAQRNHETLARIYLYEKEYSKAMQLAYQETYDTIPVLIAEGIREVLPQEAIRIYERLVNSHIDRKKREAYASAARHAKEIKDIYESILKDTPSWQTYLQTIRTTYKRLPALQDEFQKLFKFKK